MRLFALLGVLVALACQAPSESLTDSALFDEGEPERPDRFLGNLQDAWTDHLEDCGRGLSFTGRALSRGVADDWARLVETFD